MRLLSFLQIRPEELRMAALLALFFALVEIGRGIGANAADGLFFVRFGVENLPYMYLILGAVTFLVMLVYTTGIGRFDKGNFFTGLLGALAIVLLIERTAISSGLTLLYPFLWLSVNSINQVLGTLMWTTASEVCDTRQAKRLFSLFTSAGILGGVVGNFVTGSLARLIGTENLILVFAFLLGAGALIIRGLARRFFKPVVKSKSASGLLGEIRVGFDVVRSSPLMLLLAIAAVLFSVLYFSLTFPFNRLVSASFTSEADVAGFLGLFSGITTVVTFLVSLLVANRLYMRFGIVSSLMLLPVTYLGGFILFAINNSLAFGIVARFAQLVVLGGIASSAGATFYNVVPAEKRGQVQSFDAGVTSQIGIVLSGLLLLLSDRLFSVTAIFVLGMGVAVINIILVWRMRKAYGDALLKALREGLLDVFTAAAHGYQHLGRDSHAVEVASAGLIDVKPTVRRVSAVILGEIKPPAATGALTLALEDRDPEVRFEVVKALAALDARESAGVIEVRLHDAEARVRGAAIDAIAKLAPESIDKIESALDDEDPFVRARAAIALSHAGELDRASLAIDELVRSKVDADRIAGLGAVTESANGAQQTLVTQLTMDPNANVRRAAVEALTAFRNPDAERSLANALDDPDPRVRSQASDALLAVGADIQIVSAVLNTGSARAQDAALCALQKHGREARAVIVEWALKQIPHAHELRGWNSTLHQSEAVKSSRAAGYLHALLHQREWQIEQRVLEGLRMEDSSNAMDLVAKSLHSRSKERRAQALEALDMLADKRIARGLIPLLEETEGEATGQDVRVVIQTLTTQSDKWVRALAVYALGELMSRDLEALLGRAREDPAEIVREAAGKFVSPSTATMGGAMSETLKTLGTMDRILFLRQVPLFENLTPEELESIAELASERVFSTDEFLCRQGETGDELFVVVDGRVRVEKQVEGITKTLRKLDVGEHIGELAVLREQPRSASVIAEERGVRTLVLSGQAVRSILRDRPEVAMAMLTSLAERLSTTS